jgi:hypothetical protein
MSNFVTKNTLLRYALVKQDCFTEGGKNMKKIFKRVAIASVLVIILVVSVASVAFAAGPNANPGTCPNPDCNDGICPNPDCSCDGDGPKYQHQNGQQQANGAGYKYQYRSCQEV